MALREGTVGHARLSSQGRSCCSPKSVHRSCNASESFQKASEALQERRWQSREQCVQLRRERQMWPEISSRRVRPEMPHQQWEKDREGHHEGCGRAAEHRAVEMAGPWAVVRFVRFAPVRQNGS